MSSIIPYDMDGEAYGPAYLDLPIESLSDRPSLDTVVNPTHDAETFFSPGQPFINEGLINSWLLDIPTHTHNLGVDAETHLLELQRHIGDFPVVHPSYSVGQTTTDLTPPESTLGGSEGSGPGLNLANEDLTCVDLDSTDSAQDWPEKGMSNHVSSEQGDQYAPVDTTFTNLLVPSTPPGAFSAVAQYQAQGTPRERPKPSWKSGKRTTTMAPPASQRRQARGARNGRYSCGICGKRYAQKQGVTRHHQEEHEPNVCLICGNFQWARLYKLKEHHKKEHPNVDLNAALLPGTAPGARRERTITSAPLPAPELDKWSPAESPLHPLTPLAALAKPRPKSLVAISNVGYNPRPKSPAKECVQFAKDMGVPSRQMQTWYEPEGGRFTNAAARLSTSESDPVLVPVPTPTLPGSECLGSPVFALLPAFGSRRFGISAAGYGEIQTNTLAPWRQTPSERTALQELTPTRARILNRIM